MKAHDLARMLLDAPNLPVYFSEKTENHWRLISVWSVEARGSQIHLSNTETK